MARQHNAVVVSKIGAVFKFSPTLLKGDGETRRFAETSNRFVGEGGVSIAVSNEVTVAAIDTAIEELNKLKTGAWKKGMVG
jgi:hypothetical protein